MDENSHKDGSASITGDLTYASAVQFSAGQPFYMMNVDAAAGPNVLKPPESHVNKLGQLASPSKPFFCATSIRQRDILDDGEPPPPRAGLPIHRVSLRCVIKELLNLPTQREGTHYFSLEIDIGDRVYRTPVCSGNASSRSVR